MPSLDELKKELELNKRLLEQEKEAQENGFLGLDDVIHTYQRNITNLEEEIDDQIKGTPISTIYIRSIYQTALTIFAPLRSIYEQLEPDNSQANEANPLSDFKSSRNP